MTTSLCFLRHATAQDRALGLPDAGRTLTDKGKRQTRTVARFCEKQGLLPRRLLCSPLVRAVETAALLHHHLPGCPAPQVVDWLVPGTPAGQALDELHLLVEHAPDPDAESLWLVGHEPDLSDLISRLLGSQAPVLRLKKASLTRLEITRDLMPAGAPPAQLVWSLPCALMG